MKCQRSGDRLSTPADNSLMFEHTNSVQEVTSVQVQSRLLDSGDESELWLYLDQQCKVNSNCEQLYSAMCECVDDRSMIDELNGIEEFICYSRSMDERIEVSNQVIVEKFDSAASACMSGVTGRIERVKSASNVGVTGFNGSISASESVGVNQDGKKEYFVPSMPPTLALLCAHAYASEGAAVLHRTGGVVLRLSDDELAEFLNSLQQYEVIKRLVVNQRTYEVAPADYPVSETVVGETAHHSAVHYFNSKVNVSDGTERVLTMLLSGLSFNDWYTAIKNGSIKGLPPDATIHIFNRFAHQHGKTPDVIRLALPKMASNQIGLMTPPAALTRIGERVEVDVFQFDLNDESVRSKTGKVTKLKTYGGALAIAICVDCYSGYGMGILLKSLGNAKGYLELFIQEYKLYGRSIEVLAADSGVVSQAMFNVLVPETERWLHSQKIRTERAEPHNHSRGVPTVERYGRSVKELERIARTYILLNDNRSRLGFTDRDIKRLYGEIALWAIIVINMKHCPHDHKVTKFQKFRDVIPNIQDIRILPIYCFLFIVRPATAQPNGEINQIFNQLALYVGPSSRVQGAVKAVYKIGKKLFLIHTSRFGPVTDGGGLNLHQRVQRSLGEFAGNNGSESSTRASDNNGRVSLLQDSDIDGSVQVDSLNQEISQDLSEDVPASDSNDMPSDETYINAEIDQVQQDGVETPGVSKSDEISTEIGIPESVQGDNVVPVEHAERNREPTRRGPGFDKNLRGKKVLAYMSIIQQIIDDEDVQEEVLDRILGDEQTEMAMFADWSQYDRIASGECMYFSLETLTYIQIGDTDMSYSESTRVSDEGYSESECGFRAVTEGVPRNMSAALIHPVWGAPTRVEHDKLVNTHSLVTVDSDIAKADIASGEADLVILFPVFEEKMRDGELVKQVRIVGDGRTQFHAGETYSATPSREELLILYHTCIP